MLTKKNETMREKKTFDILVYLFILFIFALRIIFNPNEKF